MLKGIHPLASDRVLTYAERVGATAALIIVIGFRPTSCRRAGPAYHAGHS
jgi:hypothetical protein